MPGARIAQTIGIAGWWWWRNTRDMCVGDDESADVLRILGRMSMRDPGADIVADDVDAMPFRHAEALNQRMNVTSCGAEIVAGIGLVTIAKSARIHRDDATSGGGE